MKKLVIILIFTVLLASLAACENIADSPVPNETNTVQIESPPDTEVIPEITESETVQPETTVEITESITETEETDAVTTQQMTETTAEVTSETQAATQPVTVTEATTSEAATTVQTTEVTTVPIQNITIDPSGYNALNFSEQKAVWISFLEFQRILKNNSESGFRAEVQKMYQNCKDLGINTVYVHARSHSDAYYRSELFPWSKNVCGEIGAAPGFDPFQILVDEAHARGLSFHAWINPMRGMSDSDMKKLPDNYIMKKWYNDPSLNGKYIVQVNGIWYFSPAYEEVRTLITDGVREIISRYNVDGIHIDDYFYPTVDKSFDKDAFSKSGSSDLTQWRLDTISNMVRDMYSGAKQTNSTVIFGISPQGNINNNYSTQYADVRRWASESGFTDYLVPQIYFGYSNKYQPYETNLESWCSMVTNPDIKLITGLAVYKIGTNEGEWATDSRIISRQVESFRKKSNYGGAAFFRYDSMFMPSSSVSSKVNKEMEELKQILNKT